MAESYRKDQPPVSALAEEARAKILGYWQRGEANHHGVYVDNYMSCQSPNNLIQRLADALEATERRAEDEKERADLIADGSAEWEEQAYKAERNYDFEKAK